MKQSRGFALMDPNQQREVASKGGRMAHQGGNAHEFTREQAQAANAKMHANKRAKKAAARQALEVGSTG